MKSVKYTEGDMIAFADERTLEAEIEAENIVRESWAKLAQEEWGAYSDESWLEDGIFKTALGYLEARRRDLESGYCSPHAFSGRSSLVKVLQQDFGYAYERYEWTGRTFDPDDGEAFDLSEDAGCLEPESSLQAKVAKSFEMYLTAGAAKAKEVGSDSYLAWRKALIDCVFVYRRFSSGCSGEKLEEFLEEIQKAAQVTWADQQIFAQMKVSRHRRVGVKKGGKKAVSRRGVGA